MSSFLQLHRRGGVRVGDIARYSQSTDARFKILLNFQIACVTPASADDRGHSPSIGSSSNDSMTSWPRSMISPAGGPCLARCERHDCESHSPTGLSPQEPTCRKMRSLICASLISDTGSTSRNTDARYDRVASKVLGEIESSAAASLES